jgi:hypothetical protein
MLTTTYVYTIQIDSIKVSPQDWGGGCRMNDMHRFFQKYFGFFKKGHL